MLGATLGRMTRFAARSLVAAALLTALVVLASCSPERGLQCDGALPRWMLHAQGYDGGGCAMVLPSHEAPPNADWTLHCMGLCDVMEPWPPPSGD